MSLKKKEAVNNSPTKTSEDLGTQVLAETETHKTTNIQEPTKPESQEPTGSVCSMYTVNIWTLYLVSK